MFVTSTSGHMYVVRCLQVLLGRSANAGLRFIACVETPYNVAMHSHAAKHFDTGP